MKKLQCLKNIKRALDKAHILGQGNMCSRTSSESYIKVQNKTIHIKRYDLRLHQPLRKNLPGLHKKLTDFDSKAS